MDNRPSAIDSGHREQRGPVAACGRNQNQFSRQDAKNAKKTGCQCCSLLRSWRPCARHNSLGSRDLRLRKKQDVAPSRYAAGRTEREDHVAVARASRPCIRFPNATLRVWRRVLMPFPTAAFAGTGSGLVRLSHNQKKCSHKVTKTRRN